MKKIIICTIFVICGFSALFASTTPQCVPSCNTGTYNRCGPNDPCLSGGQSTCWVDNYGNTTVKSSNLQYSYSNYTLCVNGKYSACDPNPSCPNSYCSNYSGNCKKDVDTTPCIMDNGDSSVDNSIDSNYPTCPTSAPNCNPPVNTLCSGGSLSACSICTPS